MSKNLLNTLTDASNIFHFLVIYGSFSVQLFVVLYEYCLLLQANVRNY